MSTDVTSTSGSPANVADVEEAMRDVVDPELGINVVDLGLVSFAAIAQLAPGVLAALLWPRATRRGGGAHARGR